MAYPIVKAKIMSKYSLTTAFFSLSGRAKVAMAIWVIIRIVITIWVDHDTAFTSVNGTSTQHAGQQQTWEHQDYFHWNFPFFILCHFSLNQGKDR